MYATAPNSLKLSWENALSFESSYLTQNYYGGVDEKGNRNQINQVSKTQVLSLVVTKFTEYIEIDDFLTTNLGQPIIFNNALYCCESFKWTCQNTEVFTLDLSLVQVFRPSFTEQDSLDSSYFPLTPTAKFINAREFNYGTLTDTLTTPNGTYSGSNAFYSGVLLADNRVFCVPFKSTTARIFNPSTNTLTTPSGTYPGNDAFAGGVLLPDGQVFCIPYNATHLDYMIPLLTY
jgi:hypothetical protein